MSKNKHPREVVSKVPWPISHKESPDGKRMDIVIWAFEKLEVVVMSIPMEKATPAIIMSVEEKLNEALRHIQADPSDPNEQLELCASINEDTGAQEVYFTSKNGLHQVVVSSSDFEV